MGGEREKWGSDRQVGERIRGLGELGVWTGLGEPIGALEATSWWFTG